MPPPISDDTRTVAGSLASMRVRGARLTVTKGPDAGRAATLDQPTFVIGTGEGCDVRLTDGGVSREHVHLSLGSNGIRIRDQGSKNGTWLGAVRVRDVVLAADANVVIGSTTLSIALDAEATELPLSARDHFGDAFGASPIMRNLFATLERVAPTELTILLEGESGTGKDLLANAVHRSSTRADAPLVVVDCASIPPNLVESELFGHSKGAFTGADRDRRGVFEEANGGTLFLDEIGDLPLDVQPKLLRALEAKEVRPIGARAARKVDVRVIAATSRRLAEAARTGEFRSDLFYRLAVVRLTVPPLRDRPEDILPIARAMLRVQKKDVTADFPPDDTSMLVAYSWPGNVRELRNVVERWAVLGRRDDSLLEAGGVTGRAEDELVELSFHEARRIVLDRFERSYLPRVLARANGVVTRAAEHAQVARPSFYRMLERINGGGDPE